MGWRPQPPFRVFPVGGRYGAAQGRVAAQVLPVPEESRLVGRRGLPWNGPAAWDGMPGALRRGVHMCEVIDPVLAPRVRYHPEVRTLMTIFRSTSPLFRTGKDTVA